VCGFNSGMIINSTNNGTVLGDCEVGGVCGTNYDTITNSTNNEMCTVLILSAACAATILTAQSQTVQAAAM